MTPTIGLIISGILAALSDAPKAIELVVAAKDYIKSLVAAGVIPVDLQDRIDAHVDAHAEAVSEGRVPPGWEVEPDPV